MSYLSPEPKLGMFGERSAASSSSVGDLSVAVAPRRPVAATVESGPLWVGLLAREGRSPPAYAYSENNPVAGSDPDGLGTHFTSQAVCRASPYDCPLMLECGSNLGCELIACGDAKVASLPEGMQNLVIKAWCAYTCYQHPGGDECGPSVSGHATAMRTFWGGWLNLCHE